MEFEPHHTDIIMMRLNKYRNTTAKNFDFRIQTKGCNFPPVHKSVVGPLSDFFDAMFNCEMKETYQNQGNLNAVSKEVMKVILDFFQYRFYPNYKRQCL